MDAPILAIAGVFVMVAALFLIPIGLPGIWLMILVLAAGAFYGMVSWPVLLGLSTVAVIAELAEFALVKRTNIRYGGSNRAFWGALAGGLIGVLLGVPIPIVGSVIAGFIGSFVGAAMVTLAENRTWSQAGRVGWGVVVGRVLSAVVKTGAGIVILVLGGTALLIR